MGDDAACRAMDQLGQPRVGPCGVWAIEFHGEGFAAAVR